MGAGSQGRFERKDRTDVHGFRVCGYIRVASLSFHRTLFQAYGIVGIYFARGIFP